MNAIVVILSGLLQNGTITGLKTLPVNVHLILLNFSGLFNGQFFFVMKFFGEILLVFFIGGIIGKLLHLDKVIDSDSDAHTHSPSRS